MVAKTRRPDRRIQKTRTQLYDALAQLVAKHGYDAVTVQDVLDRANIGRSTFYTHFRDKDELLLSGIHHLREVLAQESAVAVAAGAPVEDRMLAFSRAMFIHAHGFHSTYRGVVGSQAGAVVKQRMQAMVGSLMEAELVAARGARSRTVRGVPRDLFILSLASTFTAVMGWWLDQRPLPSPDAAHKHFRALVRPMLEGL